MDRVNLAWIQEHLAYKDGELVIKSPWFVSQKKGDVLGYDGRQGYQKCRILGVEYYVHRLIWALHHGETKQVIAHIDGNKKNNKVENLLSMSKGSAITLNRKLRKKVSTTGHTGVYPAPRGQFHVFIQLNKTRIFVGSYPTVEEASSAYQAAKQEARDIIIKDNK